MVFKCSTVCLVALALLSSFCEAQYSFTKPGKPQKPIQQHPQQEKQTFEKKLEWKFPEDPKPVVKAEGPFEQRNPIPAQTVAVECREQAARVEAKLDFFAVGQLIDPADLTLGNCAFSAQDHVNQVLIFEVELQDCGSQLSLTDNALIYTFILNYNPHALGSTPVVRTSQAAVIVECHYPRRHNVSSLPLEPVWVPFSSVKIAEEFLYFSLTLMTEDFQYARPNYQYFMGQTINVEAGVSVFFRAPLRVFVDQCVATLTPDSSSQPSYSLITEGCVIDARITGSRSKFLPRTADERLQFQLEAFKFEGVESGMLYITCFLRAAPVATGIDEQHRACSYINGWKEANGFDSACSSCEPVGVPLPPSNTGIGGTGSGITGGSGGIGGIGSTGGIGGIGGTGGIGGIGSTGGIGGIGSTGGSTVWGSSSKPSNPGSSGGRKIREAAQQEASEWEGTVRLGPFVIQENLSA
uniref:Zona pellucida sperm-binding protein 3 n=1 Tax=Rhabdoblennius nitidus TaxID=879521 RepID=A0A6F8NZP6_9TELE|nr:choriogenin L [Rhabdoblennius nitidus]